MTSSPDRTAHLEGKTRHLYTAHNANSFLLTLISDTGLINAWSAPLSLFRAATKVYENYTFHLTMPF